MIKLNVNTNVKVKLTESGIAELKAQHEDLKLSIPMLSEFKKPSVDCDGYSTFQMHTLMNNFGHLMYAGNMDVPFDLEILIAT